jgi:hypothetical protein
MLMLASARGPASAPRPAEDEVRAMQVFVADSLAKVMREPERSERPLEEGAARISAGRNERESLQILVIAGVRPRRNVAVTVSELKQEGGRGTIPASRIMVNPVGYVETREPAYQVERVGWWPDPLMPPGPVTVKPGQRQPFWVTVHVPDTAAAGLYRGLITVHTDGLADREIPLEVKVWDFTLAQTSPLPSAIAIQPEILSRFYHQYPIAETTLRSYWNMLFTHRLSSDDVGDPLPDGMQAVIDGRSRGPVDFAAFDKRLEYCFPRGLTAFQGARLPGFQDKGPDLQLDQQERVVSYLGDLAGHLDSRGWLDRSFVMVWDEPRDRRAEQVLKELQVIHRANPRLRARLDGPVTGPLVELCDKEVDVWGLHMLNVARGGVQADANLARWRREGRTLWMYVACDVHHPYPNLFVDYPLIDCRVLPWMNWRYDIGGFLYWSAIWFGEENLKGDEPEGEWPNRPWVAATYVSEWEGKRQVFNGDGQFIYPGPDGTALSSVRLEALRDGMEDYEYLRLLEKGLEMLEKAELAPDLVAEGRAWLASQQVVRSFTDWTHDAATLFAAREQLASLIERVYQAALR